MTDIFREVDEDVRRDRYLVLWRRYRWLVVAGAVAVVALTAAVVGWRNWQQAQRMEQGRRFEAAAALAERGQYDQAAQAFAAFAGDASAGYAALARLREAAALAAAGDRAGAIAIYDRLAESGDAEPMVADLARLLAALQLLDDGAAEDAGSRLAPIAAGAGPWRHFARELEGLIAWQAGRHEEAKQILSELVEEAGVPDGVRGRARELLAAIGG
ncbi:MAG TPA: tetratricopeptide repeat protein [Kiloniellales bacterium]